MARRLSRQTVTVIRAMGEEPERWSYGYALLEDLGLKAGSLYPILMRLSERGLLESKWEVAPQAGRPARHLYRLTAEGARVAVDLGAALDPVDNTVRVQAGPIAHRRRVRDAVT